MVNSTSIGSATLDGILHSKPFYFTLIILTLICFCFFIYFMAVILTVYFKSSQIQEKARYILFIHMLINDTLYLILGLFMLFVISNVFYFPVPICYVIVTIASSTFYVTPYNLAAMCLERYVAICVPLRHAELCTRRKSFLSIVVIWIFGLLPNIVDFILLCFSVQSGYFSFYCICARFVFLISNAQKALLSLAQAWTFSLVGTIMLFTYIKIMLVARKMESGNASVSKAGKTILFHAFQLVLCLTAFSYTLTETYLSKYIYDLPLLNFLIFMCLPRFISPFIYGLRDEVLRKYIKKFMLCKTLRQS